MVGMQMEWKVGDGKEDIYINFTSFAGRNPKSAGSFAQLVPSSLKAHVGFDLQVIRGDFLILSTSILEVERPL